MLRPGLHQKPVHLQGLEVQPQALRPHLEPLLIVQGDADADSRSHLDPFGSGSLPVQLQVERCERSGEAVRTDETKPVFSDKQQVLLTTVPRNRKTVQRPRRLHPPHLPAQVTLPPRHLQRHRKPHLRQTKNCHEDHRQTGSLHRPQRHHQRKIGRVHLQPKRNKNKIHPPLQVRPQTQVQSIRK